MELRQLRYLIAVVDAGSFTRGAKTVPVAQPALSGQIQKLEAELGVPLLDRTTRRLALTPTGEEVVAVARQVLDQIDALTDSIRQTTGLLKGRVTVGITQAAGPMNLARSLGEFRRQHCAVELIVREGLSVNLADELRADRVDLALIGGINDHDRRQLELEPCRVERLALLVPATHRLAGRRDVGVVDLEDEPLVSFPSPATIRQTVERAAASHGVTLHFSTETSEVSQTAALVAEGLGVAVLPESDAQRDYPNTVAVALHGPELQYQIFLAWRAHRRLSPGAATLKTVILGASEKPALGSDGEVAHGSVIKLLEDHAARRR